MTRSVKYSILALFALAVIIGGLNFLWTGSQVNSANQRAQALCQVNLDLSGAPVAVPNPVPVKPPLGVKIVSDFRVAWKRAGCPGELNAPDPTFLHWASHYHLPVG